MDIEDLVSHAARFDAGFSNRIRGASPAEIAKLEGFVERLSGLNLPTYYKAYLERLGASDGGLRPPAYYPSMKIQNIIEYYEALEEDKDAADLPPPHCVLVGYTGVALFDLSLLFGLEAEPSVVFTLGSEIKGPCAQTLEKMLHRCVFMGFRMPKYPLRHAYLISDGAKNISTVRVHAEGVGFRTEWFSDDNAYCASLGNVCLLAQLGTAQDASIVLVGKDQSRLDGAISSLRKGIPFEQESGR